MIEAQDLRCGDRIRFRDIRLTVLSAFTDMRHSQTILTCRSDRHLDASIVYVLRLVRTFKFDTLPDGIEPLTLVLLENTDDEVRDCKTPVFEGQ